MNCSDVGHRVSMNPMRLSSYPWAVLLALGVAMALARFVSLSSPAGFAVDEGTGAAHAVCLARGGTDADGYPWPTYFQGIGGTHTPHFVYFTAGWSKVFGESPSAFRAAIAFIGVMSILILALTVGRIGGREAAIATLVSGAVSPWAFQFSRVAWDPPLAPFFLILAMFCLVKRQRFMWAIGAGVALASSAYTYPPQRVQLPLLLILMWLFAKPLKIQRRHLYIAVAMSAFVFSPMLYDIVFGDPQVGRYGAIGVFGHDARMKALSTVEKLVLSASNLALHFRPSYLFVFGDDNLRHSTGRLGLMSAWDMAIVAASAFQTLRWKRDQVEAPISQLVLFCFAAYLTGVLPAALTWEGLPNALRSIGAWPFLVMGVGLLAPGLLGRGRIARFGAPVVAGASAALLVVLFFGPYANNDQTKKYFHHSVTADAERFLVKKHDPAEFAWRNYGYGKRYLVRYFLMTAGGDDCASSIKRTWPTLQTPVVRQGIQRGK